MLKKLIDGKEIICSEEEEKNIRASWALNDEYPEYVGHSAFDGVNPPHHLIEEVKKEHKLLINKALQLALKDVNLQIEEAQENGKDLTSLFLLRKNLKEDASYNFQEINDVKNLKASVPALLKPYWWRK